MVSDLVSYDPLEVAVVSCKASLGCAQLLTGHPMRNTRKKKTPVTSTEKHHPSANGSSNSHTTRTLIRRFHVLLKKQRQLQKNASSASNAKELRDVEQEIEQLGGLAAYQRMSSIGQGTDRGGGSEKVLIKWLVCMGLSKKDDKGSLRCAHHLSACRISSPLVYPLVYWKLAH